MTEMKNCLILRTIPLLIAVCLVGLPAQAKYGGGSGTAEDPYQIATAADLIALGETPADYDKHFILTADIDLSGHIFTTAVIAPDSNSANFDFQGTPFTGSFDGNNFRITDLKIDAGPTSNNWVGLFGKILPGGQVRNLGLEGVAITGSDDSVGIGGLAAWNKGCISGCHVTGSISAGDHSNVLGGLTGGSGGSITDCYAEVNVRQGSNSQSIGGLAGGNGGSIQRSYARGSVGTGNDSRLIGGLVGVGGNYARITDCYAICDIVAGDNASGLGGLTGRSRYDGSLTNCYAAGTVTMGTNCTDVGGLVGVGGGVTNSYWDIQMSGLALSGGGSGKTTAELRDPNTFLGWNCCGEITWTIDPGNDYPRLAWENTDGISMPSHTLSDFLAGSGTAESPYRISSAEDLDKVGRFLCDWDKHFVLAADIDLSAYAGDSYHIIGSSLQHTFAGVFDGNGHVIRSLVYEGGTLECVGIFGCMCGTVMNLGLEDVNITCGATSYLVGGLAGGNYGSVTNCYADVNIVGGDQIRWIGGLIGRNYGTIANCYATGTICGGRASGDLGGLTGINGSTIEDCYARVNLTCGNDSLFVGGLVGSNGQVIVNCFAAGRVLSGSNSSGVGGLAGYSGGGCSGSVFLCENSFWDIEASGQASSPCGIGKTTTEMQTAKTFLDAGLPAGAGWDFVGETDNGTEDIWAICEGQGYPKLAWEFVIGDYNGDGHTDFMDFCILAGRWIATANSFWCGGGGTDLTNDGLVDLKDLMVFGENWLRPIGP